MRGTTKNPLRATLTIPEVAVLLDLNRASAYELAARGELPVPTFRSGRKILVSRHHVEALLGPDAVSAILDRSEETTAA